MGEGDRSLEETNGTAEHETPQTEHNEAQP
jgi:hypothetical protein